MPMWQASCRFYCGSNGLRIPRIFGIFVFFIFLLNSNARATSASDPTSADDFFDLSNLGYAGVPILGYDDKDGWVYGGAAFVYSDLQPSVNAGLYGVTNFNNFNSTTLNYEQRQNHWLYAFHGLAERAFDYYYGEGDLTSTNNPFLISMDHYEARPALLYRFFPHFLLGAFDDYRSRLETGILRVTLPVPGDPTRLFPDENTNTVGLQAEWDTRDKIINTRKGDYYQLFFRDGPSGWTSWPDAEGFMQLELDLRRYRTIYRHLTLASRFLGAISQGAPSYLFRYRLGGLDTLQGYEDNRFRGADYFHLQEELRWFLVKWLSVNLSGNLGDIGDGSFHQLKTTAQIGLRVGIPPDWTQKIRMDLGYGFDQQTFQIQFGEIF